ncbi:helix-turn-helix domain-containing protein [Streptomyces sp. NPDC058290]|uniref:helix-turn-helix domain-containing protein n=1 Tax=Streptomyces sp. NPDC058290 TaxID=3346426 RepID=UPI0036E4E67B
MGAPEGTVAYATALRKALDGYLAGGGTQTAIATGLGTSTASVSRYLSGERIAPREKLHAIKAFLEARSLPCPEGVWAELDELCGKAHLASGAAAVQRDHLKEELARACAEHQRAQWIAKQQLHGLEQRADRLTEDLRQALARAQLAERTSRILQERVRCRTGACARPGTTSAPSKASSQSCDLSLSCQHVTCTSLTPRHWIDLDLSPP